MGKVTMPLALTISDLLKPIPGRGTERRVWSIPLQGVWLPFFTASNTTGETAIDSEVLGAPLRLMRDKDGTPKFGSNGRPVVRVVRELSDNIKIVRERFAMGLLAYADTVRKAMPADYKAQVEAAQKAGAVITSKDMDDLTAYIDAMVKAKAAEAKPEAEKELVPA